MRNVNRVAGYAAGAPEERAADIEAAFADPTVDAIVCLGGGHASAQLLRLLDYELIAGNPKPFVWLQRHHGAARCAWEAGGPRDVLGTDVRAARLGERRDASVPSAHADGRAANPPRRPRRRRRAYAGRRHRGGDSSAARFLSSRHSSEPRGLLRPAEESSCSRTSARSCAGSTGTSRTSGTRGYSTSAQASASASSSTANRARIARNGASDAHGRGCGRAVRAGIGRPGRRASPARARGGSRDRPLGARVGSMLTPAGSTCSSKQWLHQPLPRPPCITPRQSPRPSRGLRPCAARSKWSMTRSRPARQAMGSTVSRF